MRRYHLTRHSTRGRGTSLDVLREESVVLRELFDLWDTTVSTGKPRDEMVQANWEHGTVGKLVLEHAAVLHAAIRDVAESLERTGHETAGAELREVLQALRPLLDRLDGTSRGIAMNALAHTEEFTSTLEDLSRVLRKRGLLDGDAVEERYRSLLGSEQSRLRSARYVRSHAPTHPTAPSWADRLPGILRIHAALDRLRGFPWAESTVADRVLAERFDKEAEERENG